MAMMFTSGRKHETLYISVVVVLSELIPNLMQPRDQIKAMYLKSEFNVAG